MCHLKIKHYIELYLSFYEWPQKWSKYRYLRHFIVSPSVIVLFYFAVVILSMSSLMACWVERLARNPYWCLYSLFQNLVRCDINLSYIKCSTIFEKHSRTVIGLYFWNLSFPFDWRIGVMIEIFIWLIGMIPVHVGIDWLINMHVSGLENVVLCYNIIITYLHYFSYCIYYF